MAKDDSKEADNKAPKSTKSVASKDKITSKRVIMGLGMLTAVMSIAYSTTLVIRGTEGQIIPLIGVLPQAVLALWISGKQFLK